MNRDPMPREWLRVVRYFKAKIQKPIREPKPRERPSIAPDADVTKDAKGS